MLVNLPEAGLPAGSVVQVELPLGKPQALLAVPRDALIIRADGMSVFRVGAGNKAERVAVDAGVADGDWVAVSAAGGVLAASDAVVVRGGENLQHGAIVKVIGTRSAWNTGPSSQQRSSP